MAIIATTLHDTTAMAAVRLRWASRRASSSRRFRARASASGFRPVWLFTRPVWRTGTAPVWLLLPLLLTPPLACATRSAVVFGLVEMGVIILVASPTGT